MIYFFKRSSRLAVGPADSAIAWLVLALVPVLTSSAAAQEKKPEAKDRPKVMLANPLGVPCGKASKVVLRGLKLDEAAELKCLEPDVTVKILGKGKAAAPSQQEASLAGDSQIEFEVTLPSEIADPLISLVVTSPAGESEPFRLLVNQGITVVPEKEPNGGFKQAQPIAIDEFIEGDIKQPQDVDVFRYEGAADERVAFEVIAQRHGSAIDAILTLFDSERRILATSDDSRDSRDPLLEFTLPRPGVYYLSLTDAHDQGGPAHPYRLRVRRPE